MSTNTDKSIAVVGPLVRHKLKVVEVITKNNNQQANNTEAQICSLFYTIQNFNEQILYTRNTLNNECTEIRISCPLLKFYWTYC